MHEFFATLFWEMLHFQSLAVSSSATAESEREISAQGPLSPEIISAVALGEQLRFWQRAVKQGGKSRYAALSLLSWTAPDTSQPCPKSMYGRAASMLVQRPCSICGKTKGLV